MDFGALLDELDFGSDVAENEELLDRYFIETPSFDDLVNDRVDVVRGAKGTGKSALYRIIANPNYEIPSLSDVDVLRAFSSTDSTLFREILSRDSEDDENHYRIAWLTYIFALIGGHFLNAYSHDPRVESRAAEVRDALVALQLLPADPAPKKGLLKRIREARAIEVDGTLDGATGIPQVGLRIDLADAEGSIDIVERDILEMLSLIGGCFADLGLRCWILFDRLDEAFTQLSHQENTALRGLLRAHLDLRAELEDDGRTLQTKIFLRSDVFDRITRVGGFSGMTHLRDLEIRWSRAAIITLVTRRAFESSSLLREVLQVHEFGSSRVRLWQSLFPEKIQGKKPIDWITTVCTDGTRAYNPRNFLTLFVLALNRERQLSRSRARDNRSPSVFSEGSLVSSYGELSTKRLTDTVYAEYPDLRPFVQALHRAPKAMKADSLAEILGIAPESAEFRQAADALCYAGVLYRAASDSYGVSALYGAALRSKPSEQQ